MIGLRHPRVFHVLGAVLALGTVAASRANRDLLFDRIHTRPIAAAAMVEEAGSETVAPPAATPQQAILRAADGLFYVDAQVNGHRVRFLVDTGASVVVLTAADAAAIGAAPESDTFDGNVQTVGGATRMAWTTIDTVSVAGRHAHKIRAAVVRDGLPVSLLGQNALSKLGALTIRDDRLSLG